MEKHFQHRGQLGQKPQGRKAFGTFEESTEASTSAERRKVAGDMAKVSGKNQIIQSFVRPEMESPVFHDTTLDTMET